jgi:hypothetical protein
MEKVLFYSSGYKEMYCSKSPIFWDITPCSLSKVSCRFGGTCRLHLQDRSISQAIKKHQEGSNGGFLNSLFFDPEDGGDMYIQNFG